MTTGEMNMAINLNDIGLTNDELQDRVVARIAAQLLTVSMDIEDDDGEGRTFLAQTSLGKKLAERVKTDIDAAVSRTFDREIRPMLSTYIENLCLQETSRWGDKVGQPVTFTEYLVGRCDAYIREPVDMDGVSADEARARGRSFSGAKDQTRLTFMVHRHLQYSIDSAVKDMLATANSVLSESLADTCKMKLTEISKSLKVAVKL